MQITDILLAAPWLFIILALILRWRLTKLDGVSSVIIVILFGVKVFATFTLQAIYTYFYTDRSTADIYRFFDDGMILNEIAAHSPMHYVQIILGNYDPNGPFRDHYFDRMNSWIKPFESGFYNDNITMIKLNSVFGFISDGRYEIHSILFSGLAMMGLIALIKSMLSDIRARKLALIITGLFPSYLLMMSGGLKETVLLIGAGIFFYSVLNSKHYLDTALKRISAMLIGLSILILVKPYFIASVLPALILYKVKWVRETRSWVSWITWVEVLSIGAITMTLVGFNLVEFIAAKQNEFINYGLEMNVGSMIEVERLENSFQSILMNLPQAIISAIVEPFPWKVSGLGTALMFIENIFLFTIIGIAWGRSLKYKIENRMIRFAVQAVIPGIILIGLISPVLGATMRYRAPFIILILIALTPYLAGQLLKNEAS